jgi:hypothetical protein
VVWRGAALQGGPDNTGMLKWQLARKDESTPGLSCYGFVEAGAGLGAGLEWRRGVEEDAFEARGPVALLKAELGAQFGYRASMDLYMTM